MRAILGNILTYIGLAFLIVTLAILTLLLLAAKTDILHTYLRRTVFRDFSINKILPSGEAWDLTSPTKYGLPASTKAFSIPLDDSSNSPYLGAWYMLPDTGLTNTHNRPTVLYLHGIAQTRGYHHRETLGQEEVIVWGHSQGAAIATHMVAQEVDEHHDKVKLILESPFNNMEGQINATRKWYERLVLNVVGIDNMDMQFRTTHWLPRVKCPVLITHAADDIKIPSSLSQDLFQKTRESKFDISRVQFDSGFEFGHIHTHRYLGLTGLIGKFWSGELDSVDETVMYVK